MQVSPVTLVSNNNIQNNIVEQKKEYDALIKVIETVQNVLPNDNQEVSELNRKGIAFYVAAIHDLVPAKWKIEIFNLKNKIIAHRDQNDPEKAAHEVCWEISQVIYQTFFAIIQVNPRGNAAAATRTWKMFESGFNSTVNKYKTTKGPFCFGGVQENYLPSWIIPAKG